MPSPRVYKHRVFEGVDLEPMDRFVSSAMVSMTTTDVSSIDIRIFRVPDETPIYEELGILPGAGVLGPVFNTLQLDARWKHGPPGYNFRRVVTNADIEIQTPAGLEPGNVYRLEIHVHSPTLGPMWSVHEYTVDSIYSRPAP